MASSDTSAAAARADQRLRAALAATVQPTTPTTNVGAGPPQGGPTHPTIPTTNEGAVLPQGGQAQPTDRASISSSVARASLLALYHFYDPPKVHSERVLPEHELPQALARALIAYGAEARTTWLLEDDGNTKYRPQGEEICELVSARKARGSPHPDYSKEGYSSRATSFSYSAATTERASSNRRRDDTVTCGAALCCHCRRRLQR